MYVVCVNFSANTDRQLEDPFNAWFEEWGLYQCLPKSWKILNLELSRVAHDLFHQLQKPAPHYSREWSLESLQILF
jgi:hypothetical protein